VKGFQSPFMAWSRYLHFPVLGDHEKSNQKSVSY